MISLDGFHDLVKQKCITYNSKAFVFPFYVAGDDVLFAVSVANLTKGIELCRDIIIKVNQELDDIKQANLTMSIGVAITFNDMPIRYYLDCVEEQLKGAKEFNCPDLNEFMKTKISLGGLTFYDIDIKKMKNNSKNKKTGLKISKAKIETPIWQYFLHDIKYLQVLPNDNDIKIGNPSFVYSLLERLSEIEVQNNDVKYINTLLYNLLPEYLDSGNTSLAKAEMLLKRNIIKQLYKKSSKKHEGNIFVLDKDTKHRLEAYLRLMLFFSDLRFNTPQAQTKVSLPETNQDMNDVRKCLFAKPLQYLYNNMSEGLREIFIYLATYPHPTKSDCTIDRFITLRIEKSMFIKLRNTDKYSVVQAAEMIALSNSAEKNTIDQRKKAGKLPNRLFFDKEQFIVRFKEYWTADFIDMLMLVYEYNHYNIKCKVMYTNQHSGGSK